MIKKFQMFITLSILLVLVFALLGCSTEQKDNGSPKVDQSKLEILVTSEVISSDNDIVVAEIVVKTQDEYLFVPTGVFVRPFTRTIKGKTETQSDVPFMVEATLRQGEVDQGTYQYEVSFPKVLLSTLPDIDQNNLSVDVRGHFTDKNLKILANVSGVAGSVEIK